MRIFSLQGDGLPQFWQGVPFPLPHQDQIAASSLPTAYELLLSDHVDELSSDMYEDLQTPQIPKLHIMYLHKQRVPFY